MRELPSAAVNLLARRLRIELGELPPRIREIPFNSCTLIIREPVVRDYFYASAFKFPVEVLNLLIYIRGVDDDWIDPEDQQQLYRLGRELCEIPSLILIKLYEVCVAFFPHADYLLMESLPEYFFSDYSFINPNATKLSPLVIRHMTQTRVKIIDDTIKVMEKILGTLFEPEDFKRVGTGETNRLRIPLSFAIRPELQDWVTKQVKWMDQQMRFLHPDMAEKYKSRIKKLEVKEERKVSEDYIELDGGIKVPPEAITNIRRVVGGEEKTNTVVNMYFFPKPTFKNIMATPIGKKHGRR